MNIKERLSKMDPMLHNFLVIGATILLSLVFGSIVSYCFSSTSDLLLLVGFVVTVLTFYGIYKVIKHLIKRQEKK